MWNQSYFKLFLKNVTNCENLFEFQIHTHYIHEIGLYLCYLSTDLTLIMCIERQCIGTVQRRVIY